MAEDKKGKKEKKLKLGLKRTVSNIIFALKQVWDVSKFYMFMYFGCTLYFSPLEFLSGTFLLHRIISDVEEQRPLNSTITIIVIVYAVEFIGLLFNGYFWNVISYGIRQTVNGKLYEKLFNKSADVELACYENPDFYDIFVRALDEVDERIDKVLRSVDGMIERIVSLSLNSFFIFLIDPWIILFALIPFALGFVGIRGKKLKHELSVARKPIKRRIKYVTRTFYQADYSKEMRLGGMQLKMIDDLKCCLEDYNRILKKYGFKTALCEFIIEFGLEILTVLGATAYSVIRALTDGGMSIADCVIVCTSIGTISHCINKLVSSLTDFNEHAIFIEDMRSFLEYEPKIKDGTESLEPVTAGVDIDFDHVSFRYEGAEHDSLEDISLHIKAGEHIALVGLNGSGKTTLVKLLLRLYDPTEGEITLGGRSIKEYSLQAYRDYFTCVFQDFGMFSMSVKQNVTLSLPEDGDDEKVKNALENSGASKKINTLKNGMETVLTREFDDNGTNLSVGEAQKVALARAFYRNSPVIILDEPSSALDPRAEYEMFENMKKASEGKTVIFISHRLASAVDADRILLLDKGMLTETGTHKELLAMDGEYAKMFRLQARNYAETSEEISGEEYTDNFDSDNDDGPDTDSEDDSDAGDEADSADDTDGEEE